MTYYYIFQNQLVTSDEILNPSEYSIGQDLNDYKKGMYVQLNEQQIQYENEHPYASPEEIWEMRELSYRERIKTPQDAMFDYFENEHNLIYINNEKHHCWDHQQIIYSAECAKACNESEFIFFDENKYFKGTPDAVIQMMREIGLYYYKLGLATNVHYRYINNHPEEIGTYNYTTGLPEIPHYTLEEVNDLN